MAFDFRALQIQASKIIASGSTGRNALLLIYPYSSATDNAGGVNFPATGIGTDVMAFFSGAVGSKGVSGSHGTTLYGGDVHYSGSLYIDGTISASQGTVLLSGSNFGGGQEVFSGISGSTLNFRTLVGTGAVSVTTAGDTVVISGSGGTGGGTDLSILDEGVEITPSASSLNFVGTAVLASASGDSVTISITGGTGSAGTIEVKATGSTIAPTASFIDFRGAALTNVTPSGFGVIVSHNTGALETQEQGSSLASDTQVLNFTGPGVSSSVNGNSVDVIISGSITTGSNFGGQAEVFSGISGSVLNFRTFNAGPNITINTNGDNIEVSGATSGLSNVLVTTNYAASAGDLLLVAVDDISASLPASPSDGDLVGVLMGANNRFILDARPNQFLHTNENFENIQGTSTYRAYRYSSVSSRWISVESNYDFRLQGKDRPEITTSGVSTTPAFTYSIIDSVNKGKPVKINVDILAISASAIANWKGSGVFSTPLTGASSGSMVLHFNVFDIEQKQSGMEIADVNFVVSASSAQMFVTGAAGSTEFVINYEIEDSNFHQNI